MDSRESLARILHELADNVFELGDAQDAIETGKQLQDLGARVSALGTTRN